MGVCKKNDRRFEQRKTYFEKNMEIIAVTSAKQQKQFIDFPHDLYANDPNYVPELYVGQRELLSQKKNPFFQHSKAQCFLAYENNKIVGRIAAIYNRNYNEYADRNVGFFGLFDVIDNFEVSKALLDQVIDWCKTEKVTAMIGPTNFTTNDTAGLLVDGFDAPPSVMMVYNKPYYLTHLQQYGFKKTKDLLAYEVTEEEVNMKSVKLATMLQERLARKGITVREANLKKLNEEIAGVREIYRSAWDKNWGFVPATDAEFDHLAEGLKLIIDPKFVQIAEHDGKMIGFALAVPDINQITKNIKRGRLFPTGVFKLLLGKRKIKKIRIILLGVVEEYRKMGIEGVFYARIISNGLAKGVHTAEASWILEDNEMMNKGLQNINARVTKRYRILELPLDSKT